MISSHLCGGDGRKVAYTKHNCSSVRKSSVRVRVRSSGNFLPCKLPIPYFVHRYSSIRKLPVETTAEREFHPNIHPSIFSSIHPPINLSSYLSLVNGGRRLSPVFQTSFSTRNIFQDFLGDPEAFPYQMGCIIPPSSSASTPGSPPNWMCLEDFQGEVSESDAWTGF